MQNPFFTADNMNRRMRWLSPALVFLLLWGAMAFAIHTHHHDDHDEAPVGDSECQLCLFASITASAIPYSAPTLNSVVSLVAVSDPLTETVYLSRYRHTRQARAPPVIS